MTVNINAANITSIRLAEQGSDPGTPASGFASLFVDTNGDLATVKDNAGGIKIATSPASGDYTLTVDGTGTAARLNASNVFTSAQVMPAGTNSAPALTTTGDTNTGIYFPAADTIGFSTGGTIRGRWTTDGLCFNADTAAANALDDYEEGDWTPTYVPQTNSFTSITYDPGNVGKYTKIGRQVIAWFVIATDALTVGSASGFVAIGGLPFTVANINFIAGTIGYSADFGGDNPSSILASTNTLQARIYFRSSANGGSTSLDVSDLRTGANSNSIYGQLMYQV